MNILKIYDYRGKPKETDVDLDNLEEISIMWINVISGDEILTVVKKNGEHYTIDSSCDRRMDFDDGEYEIYNSNDPNGSWSVFDEKWLDSDDSYDRMYGDFDEESDDEEETED